MSIRRLSKDANIDRSQHNQIELRRDCKTAKDCQGIKKIAPKYWEIHKLQVNVPNCPRIGLLSQSVRDQSATHPKPCNAGTIFCDPEDCGGIADSRRSHRNPVATRPTGLGSPPDCNRMPSVDPELALFCNPPQIAAQLTQNLRATILIAINTIKLDCTEVAKLQRIAI